MAIFTFTQPGDYGSTYFTLETVRNDQGFYDSSSLKNAEGFYSNFDGVVEDHLVTSSYIFAEVIPPGTSSFEFNPLVSGMPTGSFYFRGTGNMTVNVATYSGSYTLTPAQLYGQGILNTFALTPIPDFQSRVAVSGGYYQDIESQNTILNSIGTDLLRSASLVITPNAYKEDALYSVVPTNGNGDFTVTRATTATVTDINGNVVLEPYNLLAFSEQFDNATWTKTRSSVSANTTTAPDDTLTADSLIEDTATGTHSTSFAFTTIALPYTATIYAKPNGRNWLNISFLSTTNAFAYFDLQNGVVGTIGAASTATITEVGNGWYRCSMTATTTASSNTLAYYLASANNVVSYTGNGTSGLFIWGAQLVEGTDALSYQPTLDRLDRVRLDYSIGGEPNILLEPQRTNLAVASSQFDLWVGTANVAVNSHISPSGIMDADTLNDNNNTSYLSKFQNYTITANAAYTVSLFIRKTTGFVTNYPGITMYFTGVANRIIRLILNTTTGTFNYEFSGVPAVNSYSARVVNFNADYWRVELTAQDNQSNTSLQLLFEPAISSNGTTISSAATGSAVMWGAQLEAGAYATSYIPTTTATVTRNADSITRNNIYTNGLITAEGGTWFVEVRNNVALNREITTGGIFLNTGAISTTNNGFSLRNAGSSSVRMTINKVESGTLTNLYTTLTDTAKIAIKWNGSTADVFVNGIKEVSATAFTTTAMQNLIGEGLNRQVFINSMILYPTPLPDSKCIELTGGGFDTPELAYASIGVASESPTYLNQSVNSLIF